MILIAGRYRGCVSSLATLLVDVKYILSQREWVLTRPFSRLPARTARNNLHPATRHLFTYIVPTHVSNPIRLLQSVRLLPLHHYMLQGYRVTGLHTRSTLVVQQTVCRIALSFFIAGHLYLRNPPASIFLLHYFDDR